jgi:hypothetical protein
MKMKKGIFWSAMITPMIVGIFLLIGGTSALAAGPHGHGPVGMGPRDFQGHQMMFGAQQGLGFPWIPFLIFLILGIAGLIFLVKLLRRKSKEASMQQFIDTSFMSSHKPVVNQSASTILDQWENNITNKKENE